MAEPIAYFLTWTTYGTWLHGDDRGSVDAQHNAFGMELVPSNPARVQQETRRLEEAPLQLTREERILVEEAIGEHCRFRGWRLVEVNCRSSHVHAIVQAAGASPDDVMAKIKARVTRELRQLMPNRKRFWTEGGSKRRIFDEHGLARAAEYVRNQ